MTFEPPIRSPRRVPRGIGYFSSMHSSVKPTVCSCYTCCSEDTFTFINRCHHHVTRVHSPSLWKHHHNHWYGHSGHSLPHIPLWISLNPVSLQVCTLLLWCVNKISCINLQVQKVLLHPYHPGPDLPLRKLRCWDRPALHQNASQPNQ